MNTKRAKISSIIALSMYAISMIITIVFIVIIVGKVNEYIALTNEYQLTQEMISDLTVYIMPLTLIYSFILLPFSLVQFICVILAIVDSASLNNKTPLILILAGFIISILGIAGLILLIIEANIIEKEKNKQSANYELL